MKGLMLTALLAMFGLMVADSAAAKSPVRAETYYTAMGKHCSTGAWQVLGTVKTYREAEQLCAAYALRASHLCKFDIRVVYREIGPVITLAPQPQLRTPPLGWKRGLPPQTNTFQP